MKKNRIKRKFIFAIFSKFAIISLFIGVLIVAPTIGVISFGRQKLMEEKMFGKKAEYQGVVTLWNVDTFEGGTASRSAFLSKVALLFEKKYKGVYIKVENLTIKEMQANLKDGKKPNIFCFGTGLGYVFEEEMVVLSNNAVSDIRSNFLASGMSGGVVKAIAWCGGAYSLITTTEKVEKAGGDSSKNLKESAFELAYDKTLKNTTKHIYSLTFGRNDYVDAIEVLSRSFSQFSVVEQSQNGVLDNKYNNQSPYDAYVEFVSGNSSMLLGTQRDLSRIENRVMAGKENDYLYQPLGEYTDLVNYISIIQTEPNIVNVCKNFMDYLLSDGIQKKLKEIGMLSPTELSVYEQGYLKSLELAITEKTIVKSAF